MNFEEEHNSKRPRLDNVISQLPFSNILTTSTGHMKNHPTLSDRTITVHNLRRK